jgi:molybdopterin/thiamine biosynthesis adenylyltransferase
LLHLITLNDTCTIGRTPLDEGSARRIDLYMTTFTTDRHPCSRLDSNPQSKQASCRRPTP